MPDFTGGDGKKGGLASQVKREMFNKELKNPNNRYRLLCEKLGQTVYKVKGNI